jgi:leucine dehydrogenase
LAYHLCRLLSAEGVILPVSGLRPELVDAARGTFRATAVAPDRLLCHPVDVLSPNALGDVFDDRTLPEIRAGNVAGVASNRLRRPRHGTALHQRGILYVPDYVASAGGLIDATCEGPRYCTDGVMRACEAI